MRKQSKKKCAVRAVAIKCLRCDTILVSRRPGDFQICGCPNQVHIQMMPKSELKIGLLSVKGNPLRIGAANMKLIGQPEPSELKNWYAKNKT